MKLSSCATQFSKKHGCCKIQKAPEYGFLTTALEHCLQAHISSLTQKFGCISNTIATAKDSLLRSMLPSPPYLQNVLLPHLHPTLTWLQDYAVHIETADYLI